jgi:hypothetical protein
LPSRSSSPWRRNRLVDSPRLGQQQPTELAGLIPPAPVKVDQDGVVREAWRGHCRLPKRHSASFAAIARRMIFNPRSRWAAGEPRGRGIQQNAQRTDGVAGEDDDFSRLEMLDPIGLTESRSPKPDGHR